MPQYQIPQFLPQQQTSQQYQAQFLGNLLMVVVVIFLVGTMMVEAGRSIWHVVEEKM